MEIETAEPDNPICSTVKVYVPAARPEKLIIPVDATVDVKVPEIPPPESEASKLVLGPKKLTLAEIEPVVPLKQVAEIDDAVIPISCTSIR
jgi:hypothetical protein